jgi:hypothetical protein
MTTKNNNLHKMRKCKDMVLTEPNVTDDQSHMTKTHMIKGNKIVCKAVGNV